jgi:uncharacterized protein (TIGR02246 family)
VARTVALILMISSIVMVFGVGADTGSNQDETALRKAFESYVAAYNSGDASAVASHWSRDGAYRTQTGEYAKGPDKIKSALEKFFAENKGIQVKAALFDLQLESANRAIAKGLAVFSRPGEDKDEVLFTATNVKENGKWKLLKVEEEESNVPLATIAQLGELEWLIGDWVDQDEDSSVETTFRWAKDYAFITGTFRVRVGDRVDLEGTQMIGWDPVAKKIRSWIFDNKAGFGEGEWSKSGNTWTVNVKSILGTGQKASSINIYTYLDPNSFGWQSIGREVQGELLPDIDQVTVVRKNVGKTESKSGKKRRES